MVHETLLLVVGLLGDEGILSRAQTKRRAMPGRGGVHLAADTRRPLSFACASCSVVLSPAYRVECANRGLRSVRLLPNQGSPHKSHRPQLHRAIEAGRREMFTIRAERNALDPAGVTAQAVNLLGLRIPDLDIRIGTPPGEQSAIRAERQAFDAPDGIAWHFGPLFPSLRIPEADGPVRARRGQELPVRAEGDAEGSNRWEWQGLDAAPRRHVPDFYRLVGAGGDDSLSVRAERQAQDGMFVGRNLGRNSAHFLDSGRVPYPHHPVPVGGDEVPAVGAERKTIGDAFIEMVQAIQFLVAADIPDFHFAVHVAVLPAGEAIPIGAEGDAPAALGVGESAERFASPAVPEFHTTIVRDRGQPLAVGVKSDTQDPGSMDLQREWFFDRCLLQWGGVPNPDSMVGTCRGQLKAVGAERHGVDDVRVATERKGLPPCRHVPELDGLIHSRRGQTLTVGTEGHAPNEADMAVQRQPR